MVSPVALCLFLATVAASSFGFERSWLSSNTLEEPEDELSPYIINGTMASLGMFPYQALLLINTPSGGGLCGGSLISTRYVLTAAHCVPGATNVTVILRTTNARTLAYGLRYTVQASGITTHPRYNRSTFERDFALLRLPTVVRLSTYVQTIRLPRRSQSNQSYWAGQRAFISGWGSTEVQGTGASETLMYATTVVETNATCQNLVGTNNYAKICIRPKPSAICRGDSGGPVAVYERDGVRTLVGVNSYIIIPGTQYVLGSCGQAFGNVAAFPGQELNWISTTTGIPIRK